MSAEKKSIMIEADGWHHIPDDELQHFFLGNTALCGKYKAKPAGSHHDNDPRRHCGQCLQRVRKMMAIASAIDGKALTDADKIRIIEALDKIQLNKGITNKVPTGEGTVVVLNSEDPSRKQIHGSTTVVLNPEDPARKKKIQ